MYLARKSFLHEHSMDSAHMQVLFTEKYPGQYCLVLNFNFKFIFRPERFSMVKYCPGESSIKGHYRLTKCYENT